MEPTGCSKRRTRSTSKTRLSFEEILAKYKKNEVAQEQRRRPNKAKDVNASLGGQEQPESCPHQSNHSVVPYSFDGPVASWFWLYL